MLILNSEPGVRLSLIRENRGCSLRDIRNAEPLSGEGQDQAVFDHCPARRCKQANSVPREAWQFQKVNFRDYVHHH